MDKHIKALVKSDEILCVTELVSSNITYPNVLVTSVQSGQLNVFINGIVRTFEVDDKDLSATNAIADLSLKSGKVTDYKGNPVDITGNSVCQWKTVKGYGPYGGNRRTG